MQTMVQNAKFPLLCLLLLAVLIAALFWALSIGTVHLPSDVIAVALLDQLRGDLPIEAPGQGRARAQPPPPARARAAATPQGRHRIETL